MPSPIPKTPRVIYDNNTLAEVVCQVRIEPRLRIATDIPSGYQQALPAKFSRYSRRQEQQRAMIGNIQIVSPAENDIHHDFSDNVGAYQVTLNAGFYALRCMKYTRWEDFSEELTPSLQAFADIYGPLSIVRVGLRFVNIIDPNAFGKTWEELDFFLSKEILGVLGSQAVAKASRACNSAVQVEVGDSHFFNLSYGVVLSPGTEKKAYMIDTDFFSESYEGIEQNAVVERACSDIFRFSRDAGSLFRWCITNEFHNAMGPQEIADPILHP